MSNAPESRAYKRRQQSYPLVRPAIPNATGSGAALVTCLRHGGVTLQSTNTRAFLRSTGNLGPPCKFKTDSEFGADKSEVGTFNTNGDSKIEMKSQLLLFHET